MMPRRVRIAILLALLCHGLFILAARYRLSYDAFTHMLFADHYATNWFSLWESRWYAGFTVVSYPPLTHQLIALFVPVLGFEKAYALILWLVTTFYPLGVYAFSRIFAGKISASYTALASAILLPIYVTAHIFGQLPFLAGTLLALFSAAGLARYLREGGLHNFLLTVSLYATTMALHHAALLVQPFLIFAVVLNHVLRAGPPIQWRQFIARLLLMGLFAVAFSFLVIWPFWDWGSRQAMQTPIDHLSRHNFFVSPLAFAIFFFPLYGPLILCLPFLIRKWQPRFIGLLLAFLGLFLLGLGGTTPLPRLLFGDSWEWLTYDRFAFWAALLLTALCGIHYVGLKRRFRSLSKPGPAALRRNFIPALIFALFSVTSLGAWFTPYVLPLQPEPINMRPLVDFFKAENRANYRYLTFGFGDQFAYLNLLTQATTIDGSYHTARTLPELRESGVGQIDTVYWALKGIPAIEPILKRSGEYGVRWGLVNPETLTEIKVRWGVIHRSPFIPALEKLGWTKQETLSNGILVYENPAAIQPKPWQPPATDPFTSFSWGVFPAFSLIITLSLGSLRVYPKEAERVIRAMYSFLIGLIPISLGLWLYKTIAVFPHLRVYFTYTDALFFFSDGLILLAVILWLSVLISRLSKDGTRPSSFPHLSHGLTLRALPPYPLSLILLLFSLATLSVFWARDWRISLYVSLHLWLIFLLIVSLRHWPQAWKIAAFGFCAALCLQLITGFSGFASQSTGFLDPHKLEWPGVLDPSVRGASVVQLANGVRVLRAYGTLPHPNILGGIALISLLGTSSLFLTGQRPNYASLFLHSLGIILVCLTFSRSAWLGLLAFLGILVLKSKFLDRRRLILFLASSVLTVSLALYPLRALVFTRVSLAPVATEQLSVFGREWLTQQAVTMFRAQPLTGVGLGSFIIELASYAIEGAVIEPVHNVFLLAGSELGLFGMVLMLGLGFSILVSVFRSNSPHAILGGAALAGLGVITLFDHYLWTLAPGRALLGLTLGLWFGQVSHET